MSIELIKEDGSIVSDANSYADLDDANTYFSTRLNSTSFVSETDDNKAIALIQATRAIDNYLTHKGYKVLDDQSLEYPRIGYRDLNQNVNQYNYIFPALKLKEATCELAIYMLDDDRLVSDSMNGIKSIKVAGSIEIQTTDKTEDLIIPNHVFRILSKYATKKSGSGIIKTYRG